MEYKIKQNSSMGMLPIDSFFVTVPSHKLSGVNAIKNETVFQKTSSCIDGTNAISIWPYTGAIITVSTKKKVCEVVEL